MLRIIILYIYLRVPHEPGVAFHSIVFNHDTKEKTTVLKLVWHLQAGRYLECGENWDPIRTWRTFSLRYTGTVSGRYFCLDDLVSWPNNRDTKPSEELWESQNQFISSVSLKIMCKYVSSGTSLKVNYVDLIPPIRYHVWNAWLPCVCLPAVNIQSLIGY